MSELERLNRQLEDAAPGLWAALSPLGRRIFYPPDIPFQASQARGTRYNATIGQITDGEGQVLRLGPIDRSLNLLDKDRNKALLYSPIDGLAELRGLWGEWQKPSGAPDVGRPMITAGLTHGLALVSDLFATEGRTVVVPKPCWGNYAQIFGVRHGAQMLYVDAYRRPANDPRSHQWDPESAAAGLNSLPEGEPAIAILNLPSNPGGYMPSDEERGLLVESLREAAARRPVVVVCDDAYAGLVYDESVNSESLFWDLVGLDPNLLPIRLAGSTKEFLLFGGRVGFITLPFAPGSAVDEAMESKLKGLIRSGVGSPSALSQMVLLQALRQGDIGAEVEEIRGTLARRQAKLQRVLESARGASAGRLNPIPFNAGAFALVELANGLDAERLRLSLIEDSDVGLISVGSHHIRIAYCSLAEEDIEELVDRLVAAVSE